ncbi:hypothetical protein [Kaarinaea lacus]
MKKIILIVIINALYGCSNTSPRYTSEELENTNLAYITAKKERRYSGWYPFISSVYKGKEQIVDQAVYADRIDELFLPEGRYHFVVECRYGSKYAFPRFETDLDQLKSYEISCGKPIKGKGIFGEKYDKEIGASIKEIPNQNKEKWVCSSEPRYPKNKFIARFPNKAAARYKVIEKCRNFKVSKSECEWDLKCIKEN